MTLSSYSQRSKREIHFVPLLGHKINAMVFIKNGLTEAHVLTNTCTAFAFKSCLTNAIIAEI